MKTTIVTFRLKIQIKKPTNILRSYCSTANTKKKTLKNYLDSEIKNKID